MRHAGPGREEELSGGDRVEEDEMEWREGREGIKGVEGVL